MSRVILTEAQSTPEVPSLDVSSDLSQPLVNGVTEKDGNTQSTESAGSGFVSAEVSVSGGSDTEASKAETSKIPDDGKGHARSGSTAVKKFASFKPVSVNKTFLAAKGATPTVPSKLGEKPAPGSSTTPAGPSASSTLKPRLVAKSGSVLRDAGPRSSTTANGGKAGGAPDASAVWNKNKRKAASETFTRCRLTQYSSTPS